MKDDKVYFLHIIDAMEAIESFIEGKSQADFLKDRLLQDGVVRNLEVIGEAAKNLSKTAKAKCPDIEWQKVSGMRDILIHQYFGVDLENVWRVVINRLPELKEKILKIIDS